MTRPAARRRGARAQPVETDLRTSTPRVEPTSTDTSPAPVTSASCTPPRDPDPVLHAIAHALGPDRHEERVEQPVVRVHPQVRDGLPRDEVIHQRTDAHPIELGL